ncbi:MAG: aminotransferase class V-fold PLP-dependent enzyme [Asgard group archaeon]|nr:aminotransferase class V-fold PLP-dependent enzyme [Asgard group archaeon]
MAQNLKEIRKQEFPQLENIIWLNSAATVPLPASSVKEMEKAIEMHSEWQLEREDYDEQFKQMMKAPKKAAAKLMACNFHDFAYINNTAHGLNFLLHALDWESGDNIVTSALEFPTNYYPWIYLSRRKNVELRTAPIHKNGQIDEADILDLIDIKTKLVSLSLVQFSNGQKIDAKKIAEKAHEKNAFLSLDAIQAIGGIEVYPEKIDADIISAGGGKFLMAPWGIGLCYIHPRVIELIEPPFQGAGNYDFSNGDYLNRTKPYLPGAERFQIGTNAFYCIAGLHASLNIINSCGIKNIAKHNYALTKQLMDSFDDLGLQIITPREEASRAAIVNIRLPKNIDPQEIVNRMALKHKIYISARFGGVRFSTHCFNNSEEIAETIRIFSEMLKNLA